MVRRYFYLPPMALTAKEMQLVKDFESAQALLEPFRRILQGWSVETQHNFQRAIRDLELVASGDLAEEWRVKVLAKGTGVVVTEFVFNEYGRYFDMRGVKYSGRIPAPNLTKWVESKIDQGQIRYSALASRLGVGLRDPRVIRDLTWRMSHNRHTLPRRQWYNKTKTADINDLYDQLQNAMAEVLIESQRQALTAPTIAG